ncbi:AAA family ATPase [Paenibacillus hamazuiensis]|uniref:AAA family ATPase n=1 Tax=Paenibacillus hamazuiensis TaxID=2936508 RepID=UPI0020107FB1|nr:MoxR family ATPase [Paenibacillus hamazuiensis]
MEELVASMERTIVGQTDTVRMLVAAWLAGGHVLLEGAPGLGKTKLVRTLAGLADGVYRRIQFTPDLMPSDITGNVVFNLKENAFETVQGPIFAHVVLADEINRAGPKTQAALLEAMEERQVTIHGRTHPLPQPFYVVATQNPVEHEGTYPLPEAQLDRFMFKLILGYPDKKAEEDILRLHAEGAAAAAAGTPDSPSGGGPSAPIRTIEDIRRCRARVAEVAVEETIIRYIAELVRKTREMGSVQLGASPRSGIAVLNAAKAWAFLEGRAFVTPDDVKTVARPALRHRLLLTPQAELEGMNGDHAVQEALASVPVPR